MAQDQGWPVELGYDVGGGEGLARARNPEEYLVLLSHLEALHQGPNRLWLVARGLE